MGPIADGFYLVTDSALEKDRKGQDWLTDIIESVRKVTHIAPPDDIGQMIGLEVQQEGVVFFPPYGSIAVTDSTYAFATEVYCISAQTTNEQCNDAQVASIVGALDFFIKN